MTTISEKSRPNELTSDFAPADSRKNFKIGLISLYSSSSIGLRYLSAVLKRDGFDVSLIFFKEKNIALDLMEVPTEEEYERLAGVMTDLRPDLVGIGVRSSFVSIAAEITRRLQRAPKAPIVWGGTHPTVAPEECLEVADLICRGEGEFALLDLARRLSRGEGISDIPNIWAKEGGGVIRNPIRPLIEDLDSLPFPDYGHENSYVIEKARVARLDPGLAAFNMDILTSRGCPYQCSYCCNSLFHALYRGQGRPVRLRSVSNVLAEIRTQKKIFPRLKRIDFIDEVFSWNAEWVREFIEGYTKDVRLPFHCMQHPLTTDLQIMRMLKKAGLERVEIGIQSGSERVRRQVFERPVSDAKLIATSRLMRDLRIVPFYDIIVDNPFETAEDKRRGLDLLLRMARPFYMHMFSLMYFPGTVLTRKAMEAGWITADDVEGRATKSFDQMYVSLKHPRAGPERYWISLYSLTSKRFVPKRLIRLLSGVRFLRKHPGPLVAFADFCNNLKLALIAVKWLGEGKPVFSSLGSRGRSRKRGHRVI